MQYFAGAERQIVPPLPHEGGQGTEVVGVLILQVLVCRNDRPDMGLYLRANVWSAFAGATYRQAIALDPGRGANV